MQLKNYQKELNTKTKEVTALEKQAKNKEKAQTKVGREMAKLAKIEKERNEIEERLNRTKALGELKERENDLKRQNEEDQAIIPDENTSPSEREAAEARVAERNEELERLQTQVEERERELPLSEEVKKIFKKYGRVRAVFLTTGVTIRTVVRVLTNAMKATGKAMGNGLKNIGSRVGSILPGLTGSIVSFLLKTAGQAIGFLAKHTWLLILAAVVFIFEKHIKRRR